MNDVNGVLDFVRQNQLVVTVPLTILIFVVGQIINTKLKARRGVSWAYDQKRALSFSEKVKSDLVVTFKGSVVESLWLTDVLIVNTGNTEIVESDFYTNIVISLKGSRVLNAEIADGEASKTSEVNVVGDDQICLLIKLLNPKEEIRLSVLSDKRPQLTISARIKGVRAIGVAKDNTRTYAAALASLLFGSALSVFMPSSSLLVGSRLATFVILTAGIFLYGMLILNTKPTTLLVRRLLFGSSSRRLPG